MTDQDKRDKPTLVISAFVEKENKFLLVYDPKFKFWRVPGGRVEFKEKVEDCLVREMEEELGIKLDNQKFLGFGEDIAYHHEKKYHTSRLLLYYHVKTDKELTLDPKEISEHKWLTFEEIKKHDNLEPGMVDLFNRFPDMKL
jgi:ADP-ribose pyrophosphatase YjhB (NUDIX family)